MKTMRRGLLLLALSAAGTMRVNSLSAEERSDAVLKWEYRVLTKEQVLDAGKKDLVAGLNKLGDEGWELVAAEPAFYFKRARLPNEKQAEEHKRRLRLAEIEVTMWKDRVAWSERMVKKGYMTETRLQEEEALLKAAEIALDRARKELKSLPAEKELKPEK